MLKDLKLAQKAALALSATTPLGAEAAQLYALFNAAGHAGDDFSGIIHFLRCAERSDEPPVIAGAKRRSNPGVALVGLWAQRR
jgi:hypothetical protein